VSVGRDAVIADRRPRVARPRAQLAAAAGAVGAGSGRHRRPSRGPRGSLDCAPPRRNSVRQLPRPVDRRRVGGAPFDRAGLGQHGALGRRMVRRRRPRDDLAPPAGDRRCRAAAAAHPDGEEPASRQNWPGAGRTRNARVARARWLGDLAALAIGDPGRLARRGRSSKRQPYRRLGALDRRRLRTLAGVSSHHGRVRRVRLRARATRRDPVPARPAGALELRPDRRNRHRVLPLPRASRAQSQGPARLRGRLRSEPRRRRDRDCATTARST
jgi:hypothetical protein